MAGWKTPKRVGPVRYRIGDVTARVTGYKIEFDGLTSGFDRNPENDR
jgi:hypothetical protein